MVLPVQKGTVAGDTSQEREAREEEYRQAIIRAEQRWSDSQASREGNPLSPRTPFGMEVIDESGMNQKDDRAVATGEIEHSADRVRSAKTDLEKRRKQAQAAVALATEAAEAAGAAAAAAVAATAATTELERAEGEEQAKVTAAATTLQASRRGARARALLEQQRQAALHVQKVQRGREGRRRARAARALQREAEEKALAAMNAQAAVENADRLLSLERASLSAVLMREEEALAKLEREVDSKILKLEREDGDGQDEGNPKRRARFESIAAAKDLLQDFSPSPRQAIDKTKETIGKTKEKLAKENVETMEDNDVRKMVYMAGSQLFDKFSTSKLPSWGRWGPSSKS